MDLVDLSMIDLFQPNRYHKIKMEPEFSIVYYEIGTRKKIEDKKEIFLLLDNFYFLFTSFYLITYTGAQSSPFIGIYSNKNGKLKLF